jgi:hypothetical protein
VTIVGVDRPPAETASQLLVIIAEMRRVLAGFEMTDKM